MGPFNESKRKNKYILLIIDAFTKFIYLKAVKNTKSTTSITVFKDYFSLFGVPNRLITDRSTSFTSSKFKEFIRSTGIHHILNAVATPRANGQIERYNRTVLDALTTKNYGNDERKWDDHLPQVQWGLNNTINKSIGKTPSEVLFGLRLTSESESVLKFSVEEKDNDQNIIDVEKNRVEAHKQIIANQEKQKINFDKSRTPARKFDIGHLVRVEREVFEKGKSNKLITKCSGPYRIIDVLPNDRSEVEDTPITKKKG